MDEQLSLLVRSPAQRHRDLRLRAEPAWTVRRLKTELRRLLPDAPVSARSPSSRNPAGRVPAGGLAGRAGGWAVGAESPRGSGGSCRGAPGPVPAPRGVPVASAALGARSGYFGTRLWPGRG